MPELNWGMISDGGSFESLMHAILYAGDPATILFGRPGKDAGQDARSADGVVVYQAKYRQGLVMDGAIDLAMEELDKIKKYRQSAHANYEHWRNANTWVLVANFSINPNDEAKWQTKVKPAFLKEGLTPEYWHINTLEGKLSECPEVRDVFFGGENRVLVGLKEAHDLLVAECVGSVSFAVDMVGRDSELGLVKAFASSDDTRVLPVVGPGGIGKSRLLYESLIALAQDGWRVLWALPGTMAKSFQWFRLLNGSQKTCVAIDDPEDPGLLRAVIEQLAPIERRNWRVIIATRTEKSDVLRRYRNHKHFHDRIELNPLDEPTSQELVSACLRGCVPPPWLHSVYGFTHGVPGWLCLIASLARDKMLEKLPAKADAVAEIYLDSCLNALSPSNRGSGLIILRWLALWGTLIVRPEATEQAEFLFLETRGISVHAARDLLRQLVGTGMVKNWGVDKRLFAIEPLIIRQHILSGWLLRENTTFYEVSTEGIELVTKLVEGQVPAVDSALRTLSHLALTRLEQPAVVLFMAPVFSAMARIAREGRLLDQYRIAALMEKAGDADPERALDVLIAIRENVKEDENLGGSIWGSHKHTHAALVAKLPWTLFQIAEHVSDRIVALRYINEFRQLVAHDDIERHERGSGKGPSRLFKRLLCETKNSEVYAKPAHDLAVEELTTPASWPFVGLVSECLLNPIRESTEWVSKWTLSTSRRAFTPDSAEWNLAANLRVKAFAALLDNPEPAFRAPLWRVLADSHHSFHRAVVQGRVKDSNVDPYRSVVADDLTTCAKILKGTSIAISVEEATAAREMWAWYLKYGREDDPVELARQCEQIYNALPISRWRLHDFFRFETEEDLAPETARVAAAFRSASEPATLAEFFDEAKKYLNAARQGGSDMADDWRISHLADACADQLALDTEPPSNAVTSFVRQTLNQLSPGQGNTMAWGFSVRLCGQYLSAAKKLGAGAVAPGVTRLLDMAAAKPRLLWGLYGNVSPKTTGALTLVELNCILSHETGFSVREWFILLGAFYALDTQGVQDRLRSRLEGLRDDLVESSGCLGRFIRSAHITALRYDWPAPQLPVSWIIDMIIIFGLDGALLGMHDLEWLRDKAGYRLSMIRLTTLFRSRIELEQKPRLVEHFEILPHDFDVGSWTVFDVQDPLEVKAFSEFCRMALGHSYTALYLIPKYIVHLNPSGRFVADFVEQYLAKTPGLSSEALSHLGYLASFYPDDSDAWANIAKPICSRAQAFRRQDREHVYFGLASKETGVLSRLPGQIADYYVQRRETADRLLAAEPPTSPLRPYREWALLCAEQDLRREEGRAEEDANG